MTSKNNKQIKPSILVVDDISDNLELLSNLLLDLNVDVICANSGQEALKLVEEREFAVALIDINMPVMNGFETVEKIHEVLKERFLPVIFITAVFYDDIYQIKGISSGAIDFVTKPIISEVILGKVKAYLKIHQQQKEIENYKNDLENLVNKRTGVLLQEIETRRKVEQELREAKNKSEESERLKDAFISNISHEIRTPMTHILGLLDLLSLPGISEEKKELYSNNIKKSSGNLLNLFNNIIDLSLLESGNLTLTPKEFNLSDFITKLYASFSKENIVLDNKDINFHLNIESKTKDLIILSDKNYLQKILHILLENAFKFTRKGQIDIGYRVISNTNNILNKKSIEFFVKDTGVGFPDSFKESAFNNFRQLSYSDSREFEGAGISLSIAKKLTELLNGIMWIESEPDKGTSINLIISV